MRILALVIAAEARSYEKKDANKTKVNEMILSCVDFDASNIRLKDTFDVTIPQGDFTLIKGQPIGQQLWFDITEIRPNPYGPRLRFTGRVEMTQFQVSSEPANGGAPKAR